MKGRYLGVIAVVIIGVIVAAAFVVLIPSTTPAKKIKVAMSLDGGANLPGWSQTGFLAIQEVEEIFGAEIAYSEFIGFADALRDLETFAGQGFDLVWGHGGQYADVVEITDKYPNTYFMTTGTIEFNSQVRAYGPKWQEMTYLAGILAGSITKSNKVGIVLGGEFPVLKMIANGTIEGVKEVNPDAEVTSAFVGSFIEPVKGKDFATSMIQSGVDVLVSWAGFTSTGMFEAARANPGVHIITEHQDYFELGTDVSIATYRMNFTPNLVETAQMVVDGTFQGGYFTPGIKEGVLDFTDISTEVVPQSVRDEIAQVRQDIIDGNIVAPEIWPE